MPKQPRLSAIDYALRLLNYRLRSRQELEKKLTDKHYDQPEIVAAIDQLSQIGLLSDESLAKALARDRLIIARRGRQAIYWELLHKGIPKPLAQMSLKSITDSDELPVAKQLLEARLKQWTQLDDLAKKRRAIGLLQRRGFSGKVINQVLKEAGLFGGLNHFRHS
jgi:regulatory protein